VNKDIVLTGGDLSHCYKRAEKSAEVIVVCRNEPNPIDRQENLEVSQASEGLNV